MQTLSTHLQIKLGETGQLKLDNLVGATAILVIKTLGGTTIRVPLTHFSEISVTAGHDLGETGFVVDIDAPDEPTGLRLVKGGQA